MDLIIKVYNQYFRNVDGQRWKYVGYQYWYIVENWCCTNVIILTVSWQSEVGIQRWIDVQCPIVNFFFGDLLNITTDEPPKYWNLHFFFFFFWINVCFHSWKSEFLKRFQMSLLIGTRQKLLKNKSHLGKHNNIFVG